MNCTTPVLRNQGALSWLQSAQRPPAELDALVVGAGFGGIYMLHKLRNELGLDAVAIDKAGGVGGTWYWNKYPGALSDSEGFVYQYSFDRDLYAQTPWKTKYVRQPEILEYLNGVVDRYDLREHIALETAMTDASFDEVAGIWTVHTDRGVTFECRFLVNGLGPAVGHQRARLPGHGRLRGAVRAHRRVARGPGSDRQARRRDRQRLHRQPGHHRHRADRRPPDVVPAHPAVQRVRPETTN